MALFKLAKVATAVFPIILASLCFAQSGSSSVSSSDQKFVKEAASGGMAEVELGQLAQQNGSSDAVKQFGQRMVTDHGQANDKLKSVVSQKGIQLPTKLNAKDEAIKMRLSKLSGKQFDDAYIKDMITDHQEDVAAFKKESSSGGDSDIKQFASDTLPTLRDHLKQIQGISVKHASQ